MSSWLGYTVYPANGVSLEECRETLTLELDDTVVEESRFGDSEHVSPSIISKYEAVGKRASTSRNVDRSAFRKAVVEWLGRCADSITFASILLYHDTSEAGKLYAYCSENGQLQEIQTMSVTHTINEELRDPDDGYFPEYAARLHPHEVRKGETNRNRDYLAEFEEEFGYRPLTFYG